MARPRTSSYMMSGHMIRQLRELFGSARNAYDRLGLHPLELHYVQRAMAAYSVPEHIGDVIERRWEQWQQQYLMPEHRTPDAVFTLTGNPFTEDA